MTYKIFVPYKYADSQVYQDSSLKGCSNIWDKYLKVTPRDYLNEMSKILADVAIEKWEPDGEDLSHFKDSTIESKLRNMIYDSSVTIVLISPGMRDCNKLEKDQWIPWEIAYSLRESTRNGRTSHPNALVAVVLPDQNNSYNYCIEKQSCGAEILKFNDSFCFSIIGNNFFNRKEPNCFYCKVCQRNHYCGYQCSYIVYAKWCDFIKSPESYIKKARDNQAHIAQFNIQKSV